MSRDTSHQRQRPPEFFLDRCLPPRVAFALRERDWVVHCIVDHFPNDAQRVEDEEWLAMAEERGWVGLTQDGRIWMHSSRRLPVFCLKDADLGIPNKIRWLLEAEQQIMRLAGQYKPGLWIVHEPPKPVRNRYKGRSTE